MPDDDHGDPRNITNKTFEKAGEATDMPGEVAKNNTRELLDKLEQLQSVRKSKQKASSRRSFRS